MRSIIVVLFASTMLVGADLSVFVGTWKQDMSKRNMAERQIEFQQSGENLTAIGTSPTPITFKVDGKDYPTNFRDDVQSWSQVDGQTWRSSLKSNGKQVSTAVWALSSDGKTLTVKAEGKRPNGEAFTSTALFTRTSGNSGLVGRWQAVQMTQGTPEVIKIDAVGENRLHFLRSSTQAEYTAPLDGQAVPYTDAMGGGNVSVKLLEPRSIQATVTMGGATNVVRTFNVSPDGKELVETVQPSNGNSIRVFYNKQ